MSIDTSKLDVRQIEVTGTLGAWRLRPVTADLPRFVKVQPARMPYREQSRRERLAWRRFLVAGACLFAVFLAGALLERGERSEARPPAAVATGEAR